MFTYNLCENTYLRKIEMRDAAELFALIDESREYLQDWLGWVGMTKAVADIEAFIKSEKQRDSQDRGYTTVIVHKGTIVGVVAYVAMNHAIRAVEIGYWLGKKYAGKGLMTKACPALVENAFQRMNFNRVEIRAAAQNIRSQSVARRLGFVQEGVIRDGEFINGRYSDLIVFSLLKQEYVLSNCCSE